MSDLLWHGEGVPKTGNNVSKDLTREKFVAVVKLRHAKVVVSSSRRYPRKNQWHEFVSVSHRRVVIFPEKTLWGSLSGVEGVL